MHRIRKAVARPAPTQPAPPPPAPVPPAPVPPAPVPPAPVPPARTQEDERTRVPRSVPAPQPELTAPWTTAPCAPAIECKPPRRPRLTAPAHITFRYESRELSGVLKRLQGKRRFIHVLTDPARVLDRAGGALAFLASEIDVASVRPIVHAGRRPTGRRSVA